MINNFSVICRIPRSFNIANKNIKEPGVLRHSDNNKALYTLTDGAKLRAQNAAGFLGTALGCADFTHLHTLNGVHYIPPTTKTTKKFNHNLKPILRCFSGRDTLTAEQYIPPPPQLNKTVLFIINNIFSAVFTYYATFIIFCQKPKTQKHNLLSPANKPWNRHTNKYTGESK